MTYKPQALASVSKDGTTTLHCDAVNITVADGPELDQLIDHLNQMYSELDFLRRVHGAAKDYVRKFEGPDESDAFFSLMNLARIVKGGR